MRVEVFDELGDRYTITLDGRITRKNALRILDIVELLGGMPGVGPESQSQELSKIEKVRVIVERHLPLVWFTPKDFQALYEKEVNESIGLSTASTYLSRLSERGLLLKAMNTNRVHYKLISKGIGEIIKNT